MRTVRVERTIHSAPEEVFEMLTDHAGYARFRGVRSAELVREGTRERNGEGAMRRLVIGPVRFEEEIVGFNAPRRMDYVIRDMNLPFSHEGGTISVDPKENGAQVVWESTFGVPAGPVSGPMTAFAAFSVRRGFERILDQVAEATGASIPK